MIINLAFPMQMAETPEQSGVSNYMLKAMTPNYYTRGILWAIKSNRT